MSDISKDLSALTNIPDKTINKILSLMKYCICEDIYESIKEQKDISESDIGIGKLRILQQNDEIKFKFIPNKDLQEMIKNTYIYQRNLLEASLEQNIADKVTSTFKEFL